MKCPDHLELINPEVFYHRGATKLLAPADIAFLKRQAEGIPRKRARICLHDDPSDAIHEMVIVHHRDAYVRPHAHRGHGESLQILEGEADSYFFGEDGSVTAVLRMGVGAKDDDRPYYYKIEKDVIHCIRIVSEWLVFLEVTAGPFDPSSAYFPSWAPDGSDPQAALAWIDGLRRRDA